MAADVNRRIVLAARAHGRPTADNFRLDEAPVPEPGPAQMLCRTIYLSLDPYMRGHEHAPSYAKPVQVGEVMVGGTVGQVVRSNLRGFAPGDFVVGYGGWQEYAMFGEGEARKIDPGIAPISTALGVLGMPGQTAYVGLREIGRPKAGETLVVAAASGPVGLVVGQIAKIRGCRVVGIAGSKAKCDYVSGELGFDACLDHHAPDFEDALRAACPTGSTSTGRTSAGVFEAVLPLLNDFARVPVWPGRLVQRDRAAARAGSHAAAAAAHAGPAADHPRLHRVGFRARRFPARSGAWIRDGRIRYREDIREGLENAPAAFIGLLEGENFGKLLVRVAPIPRADRDRHNPSGARTGRPALVEPNNPGRGSAAAGKVAVSSQMVTGPSLTSRPPCARRTRRARPARPVRRPRRRSGRRAGSRSSGGAARMKLGRLPLRTSAHSVNWLTTSTPPPMSRTERFILAGVVLEDPQVRDLAGEEGGRTRRRRARRRAARGGRGRSTDRPGRRR